MISIIIKYIEEEIQAWRKELLFYNRFLTRADMEEEKRLEILQKHISCMAIIRELEEERGEILNFKNEYQQYVIYSEPKETNGQKWTRFYTLLFLVVKNEEGLGAQRKYVNVVFNRNMDLSPYLEGGIFTLKNGKYTLPQIYEIKQNQETGKLEYPYMYIDEVASYQKLNNGGK